MWTDAPQICMFFSLRLHFARIMDLANLTYLVANHLRWDNYAATYAEN